MNYLVRVFYVTLRSEYNKKPTSTERQTRFYNQSAVVAGIESSLTIKYSFHITNPYTKISLTYPTRCLPWSAPWRTGIVPAPLLRCVQRRDETAKLSAFVKTCSIHLPAESWRANKQYKLLTHHSHWTNQSSTDWRSTLKPKVFSLTLKTSSGGSTDAEINFLMLSRYCQHHETQASQSRHFSRYPVGARLTLVRRIYRETNSIPLFGFPHKSYPIIPLWSFFTGRNWQEIFRDSTDGG